MLHCSNIISLCVSETSGSQILKQKWHRHGNGNGNGVTVTKQIDVIGLLVRILVPGTGTGPSLSLQRKGGVGVVKKNRVYGKTALYLKQHT